MRSLERLAAGPGGRSATLAWVRAAGLGTALAFAAAPGYALDLTLQPVLLPGQGEFRFGEAILLESVDRLPEGHEVEMVSTPHYTVRADLDDVTYSTEHGFFRYKFYVRSRSEPRGALTCFIVKGEPVGRFQAQPANVEFTVKDGEVEEGARIKLPIYGTDASGYLQIGRSWKEPEEVELPGDTEISFPLQNALASGKISVVGVRQPRKKKIWQMAGLRFQDSDKFEEFDVLPGQPVDGVVVLVPNSAKALSKVFFPRVKRPGSESGHETVIATLTYNTASGVPGSLNIEIPVVFVPSPFFLFLALAVGTLLGSVIPILSGQRRKTRWLRAFTTSLLIAIVVELLAIVLKSYDSEFRLLGIELDPQQLLSAMLIGVFMGMLGFRSLDFLKKTFFKDHQTGANV
jgi:hypothetical protein